MAIMPSIQEIDSSPRYPDIIILEFNRVLALKEILLLRRRKRFHVLTR